MALHDPDDQRWDDLDLTVEELLNSTAIRPRFMDSEEAESWWADKHSRFLRAAA